MKTDFGASGLFVLVFGVLVVFAASANAAIVTFKADLKGSNLVPPSNLSGTGYLTATLNTASNVLTWHVSVLRFSGRHAGIAFHGPANPNENAGPILSRGSPFAGSATLTNEQAADLIAGYWYAVIYTRPPRRSEIRGQVVRGR
ncbi:MAG: CHRD domain-containing protein [Rhodomicrobium sp.]